MKTTATVPASMPVTQEEHDRAFAAMMDELADLKDELLAESMTDAILAYDNLGWAPLGGELSSGRGVPIEVLTRWADVNQQLVGINPLIKRGSNIRVSYVFGEEIEYQKDSARAKMLREKNADLIFSPEALKELEQSFNTDGNLFLMLSKLDNKITRISMSEITNVALVPGSLEEKLYFQRTWVESVTDTTTTADANARTMTKKAWYPVPDLDPAYRITSINGVPVVMDKSILHVTVNKQVGWLYGIPDIQPAVFWARAYKEYLEANYTLVRALAKFAFKVTAATPAGSKRAAAKLVAATPYDPTTGQRFNAGGSAVLTAGEDLQAVNKAGANVNFEAGKPLAAMVASALEVNVVHLLSDPSIGSTGSADTLDTPQLKAMTARQAVFKRAFVKIFTYFGMPKVLPKFPPIQWEPVHRVIQAVVTAASTNGVFPEETRQLLVGVLKQYGIDPMPGLPEDGRNAEFVTGINAAEQAQQQADLAQQGMDNQAAAAKDKTAGVNDNPGTSPQKTPKGSSKRKGRSAGGALADGDHSQRKSQ